MADRRALITGGAGGLGSAVGQVLEQAGYQVVAPGRSELDVSQADQVTHWFGRSSRFDLLILNAGVSINQRLHQLQATDWDRTMAVNLSGAFRCCQAWFRQREGEMNGAHAILVSSQAGLKGAIGQSAYAASKAGLIGLARSLAVDWGQSGGRANVILPGFMETSMTASLSELARERIRAEHHLPRMSRPEEVGDFIVTLDRMPAVSGQIFNLDSRW